MRRLVLVLAVGLLASAALGQDMYARGDFNGWTTNNAMVDMGDGTFTAVIDVSGQTGGNRYEFKVANSDWSINYPGSNVYATYPASPTNLTIFYEPAPTDLADGWMPQANRVGYGPGGNPWELVGDFTDWGNNPIMMTDMGNDFWTADALIPTAGDHQFKFRGSADWEISIGSDFGRWAGNASFNAAGDNTLYRFELDLSHGRYRAYYVPEPAALLGLALLGMLIRRR